MRLRRTLVLAVLAAATFAASAAADSLPPGWSHAQINVVGAHGQAHTLVYDRGVVTAVTSSSLTLSEPDGSSVTIQVAPDAVVTVDKQPGSFSQIQVGSNAETYGVDGNPARKVWATSPPVKTAGRVTAVTSSSLTLTEKDGTVATIPVAPDAVVMVDKQPGSFSQIQPGYSATTVQTGSAPAAHVYATSPPPPPVHNSGRVMAVDASSITLRQADGTTVTIQVASDATVLVGGQPSSLSAIQPGFHATTTSQGSAPARRVTANPPPARGPSGGGGTKP